MGSFQTEAAGYRGVVESGRARESQGVVARVTGFGKTCRNVIHGALRCSVVIGFVARETRRIERSERSIEFIRMARLA